MAALVTLQEYKTALNIDLDDTTYDDQYTWFLQVASKSVCSYADRDFGAPNATETRMFQYDNSGYLDIDDASAITAVSLIVPGGDDMPLDATYQWFPQPTKRYDSLVYYYILIPGFMGSPPFDPAMGFTRNLDVYVADHGRPIAPTMINVTGTWGWPVVPDDVKQAVIWTVSEWESRDDGESLSAEAISGYSRSWAQSGSQPTPAMAIANRAMDVLANYQKIWV